MSFIKRASRKIYLNTSGSTPRMIAFSAIIAVLLSACGSGLNVYAQEKTDIDISGLWFLSYQAGKNAGRDVNRFFVHRGYLTFKPKFSPHLSARITPDITRDEKGDIKVRLKFMYFQFSLPGSHLFTKPYIEFGQAHRPWLDFEEHINYYRCQGTMFMERNHLFNAADIGVSFVSLLGGEVDKTYQAEVNSNYPGRYGSVSFGMYNGGGYHAEERNTNKVLESRVSIRPVPDTFPGLQLSYFGIIGRGNTGDSPDWTLNAAFVSLEHKRYTVAGTYYTGRGNSQGTALDSQGNPCRQSGYSGFGELKFPASKFSIIGRYDSFDPDTGIGGNNETRTIIGAAYHFYGAHKALLDWDYVKNGGEKTSLAKFTIEVHF